MNQKFKSTLKLSVGILLVIGGFPAVVSSLLIAIGGAVSGNTDSYVLGKAVGGFVGSFTVWILGVWLLISWNRKRVVLNESSKQQGKIIIEK